MTKFETVAAFPGQQFDEGCQPLGIGMKLQGQLKQDRTGTGRNVKRALSDDPPFHVLILSRALAWRSAFSVAPERLSWR
jgi:hypothetical protein